MSEAAGSVLAGNPAPEAAAGATQPAQEAVSVPEWAAGLPDEHRTTVGHKKWADVSAVIDSYVNLEKYLGADKAGRGLVLPKDDAPAEEWGAFWGKIGRPETPDGYKLPVPEGDDGAFAKAAAAKFHELGIPAKQAEALAAWNNEMVAQYQAAESARMEQTIKAAHTELQKAFGPQYDANIEMGRRAFREAGWSPEMMEVVELAVVEKMGPEAFRGLVEGMAKLGRPYTEAPMRDGESRPRAKTAEQAKAELKELAKDKAFSERRMSGDKAANDYWYELNVLAVQGG